MRRTYASEPGVTLKILVHHLSAPNGAPQADWTVMDHVDINEVNEPPLSAVSVKAGKITHKASTYLIALTVTAGAVSLVLFSPLLFRQLGSIKGVDWTKLSNVGQTYGAASAILSAIALLGVSLSLLVQARQARTERIRITRERQMELLKIILEAPDIYYPVVGTRRRPTIDARRSTFSNMWFNYARLGFHTGVVSETDLREDILQRSFAGEPMRKWWAGARRSYEGRIIEDRKERRFIEIADEEYRKAVSTGPPISFETEDALPNAAVVMESSQAGKRRGLLKGAVLGLAIGIALGSRQWPKHR
jgi:hypothetical protein